jgi:hypothetical protein
VVNALLPRCRLFSVDPHTAGHTLAVGTFLRPLLATSLLPMRPPHVRGLERNGDSQCSTSADVCGAQDLRNKVKRSALHPTYLSSLAPEVVMPTVRYFNQLSKKVLSSSESERNVLLNCEINKLLSSAFGVIVTGAAQRLTATATPWTPPRQARERI